ncbi:MAG: dTDP-4-dehydrorhamnose 3,5-epimerase family protein [Planctomycetes bacterium]|nr:dTDP-4-dehydrorhamnose 3,5-epimerase family protein [Planctomycetota bacterium]
MIDGVKVKKLKFIPDERGRLMEILRVDDEVFDKFGQVYITTAYPGVVKAWHYHKIQTDHFAALHGKMKVVLYDARENSPTKGEVNEFTMGQQDPILVKIPPMVYHGFTTLSDHEAIMLNCPTEPYNRENPDEYRIESDSKEIPYDWKRQDG